MSNYPYSVYKVYRNQQSGYWEVAMLTPDSVTPEIFPGEETTTATVKAVKERYEGAMRLTEYFFQKEVEARTTHTPEMLDLLVDNWTGQDLSAWHVYGSILRPMNGIRIDNTVFLNGNHARYQQYEIYTYVVSPEPLDEQIMEHYTLVTISHPESHTL